MKGIRGFFDGRDELLSKELIIKRIEAVPDFDPASESIENAEALLIFQTSRQQTWLVSTEERLYCLLDDKLKREPESRWTVPRSELVDGHQFVLPIETRDNSPSTGLVDLGPKHKNWYFSKPLFDGGPSVATAIAELVSKKMIA